MQVEHITLAGNTAFRDTDGIDSKTIELLEPFMIKEGVQVLKFPRAGFDVRVSAAPEGAIFDILKPGNAMPAFLNVCCFDAKHTNTMLQHVHQLAKTMKIESRMPVLGEWLYTIPLVPFLLKPEQIIIAGEVELYIYYQLFLAQ